MPRTRFLSTTVTLTSPVSAASEVYLGHWVPKHDAAIWAARLKLMLSCPSTSLSSSATGSGTFYVRELSKLGLPYLQSIQNTTVSAGSSASIATGGTTGLGTTTTGALFPVLANFAFTGISTGTASSPLIANFNLYSTGSVTGAVGVTLPLTDYGFVFTFLKTTNVSTDTVAVNFVCEGQVVMNNER